MITTMTRTPKRFCLSEGNGKMFKIEYDRIVKETGEKIQKIEDSGYTEIAKVAREELETILESFDMQWGARIYNLKKDVRDLLEKAHNAILVKMGFEDFMDLVNSFKKH